ncbi:MAG: GNAT family N-acetyltransferase [Nocardioides sp.]
MPELTIRRVDHRDSEEMAQFQRVYAEAELAGDPDASLYSLHDTVAYLSSTEAAWFYDGFAAYDGDQMVGEAMVTGARHDNQHVARIWVWVPPQHARRGHGTRLAAYAEEHARSLGRTVAHATAGLGTDLRHRHRRFAERLGYALANTEVERRLPLPVDPGLLDRLEAETASYHPEYAVRVTVGPVPGDLAPGYVALKNLMNTLAPTGDLEVEESRETLAGLAVQDAELIAAGRTRIGAFAVAPDAQVAGYAVSVVATDDHVDQWGTLVHPSHRGRRLGMALKCAGLRAIAEQAPGKRFVTTTNAETNAPMVSINEALGFRLHRLRADFHKRLI